MVLFRTHVLAAIISVTAPLPGYTLLPRPRPRPLPRPLPRPRPAKGEENVETLASSVSLSSLFVVELELAFSP